jgi:hypothetical protein
LIADPMGQIRQVYERLSLGDFENIRPHLADYLARSKGYETNKYSLSAEERELVTQNWGDVIRRYGYAVEGRLTPAGRPGSQRPEPAPTCQPFLTHEALVAPVA